MAANDPRCGGCGGPHEFDTSVPSVLWNRIVRPIGGSEYLCAACVLKTFAHQRVSFTAVLYGAGFEDLPIAVEIDGQTARMANDLQEEINTRRASAEISFASLRALEAQWREVAETRQPRHGRDLRRCAADLHAWLDAHGVTG